MSTVSADPTATGASENHPDSTEWLGKLLLKLPKALASLQLTVWLFAASMVLIFFGTVAQKDSGIWSVVDKYFWSYVVWIDFQLAVQFGQIFLGVSDKATVAGAFPFPGGKLIGGLMFVNLLAAHLVRFKLTWKRSGVIILHGGMLLMFVGEFITREYQIEQQMTIRQGTSSNFAIDIRNQELAFVDHSDPKYDRMTVVPASMLKAARKAGTRVSHPDVPVDVEVVEWMPNSKLVDPGEKPGGNPATAGFGTNVAAVPVAQVSGVDPNNKVDLPSAYVKFFKKGTDEAVGTYFVTTHAERVQPATFGDKSYDVSLRFTHHFKPFAIFLEEFRFDRYVGTQVAKNYSSKVRIIDPEKGADREVKISMNDPLRYRGEAFFQSSFTPDEKGTVLQVVKNPGWVLPYVSCVLVSLGMLLHFGMNLRSFLSKSRTAMSRPLASGLTANPDRGTNLIPIGATLIAGLYLLSAAMPRGSDTKMDFASAARLPVVKDGRVKPLDTVARVNLRLITHKEEFTDGASQTQPAIKWYLDAASANPESPGQAAKYKIFRIENDRLLEFLKLERREGFRYSAEELRPRWDEFHAAAKKADEREDKDRDVFDGHVIELRKQIEVYLSTWLGQGKYSPMELPPGDGKQWRSAGSLRQEILADAREEARGKMRALGIGPNLGALTPDQQKRVMEIFDEAEANAEQRAAEADPAAAAWQGVLAAYRSGQPEQFNARLAAFREKYDASVPAGDRARANFETFLNGFSPFYHCTATYVFAFLLALAGWFAFALGSPLAEPLRRSAFWVLLLTFVLHTFSLASRMYLMDRPLVFVTNLYSTAIFIGWAGVGGCLLVERKFPLGLGNAVGAAIGFATGILAHNLAAGGDTLEVMQAVLDDNFWLATHVTTINLGYSATYVAGLIAIGYVVLGAFTTQLRRPVVVGGKPTDLGKAFGTIMYGAICLATILSFVGTVLGGIWADQSWGRFWGWDPKENGAVLIVIWNALILHARWCGLVKDRGVAVLALVGNMVTTWSYFGTNQLGAGLHAYGFSKTLADGCTYTWIIHLGLIAVGLTPIRFWRSHVERPIAEPV